MKMVKIYTSMDYFDMSNIIIDNESFFKNNISSKRLSKQSFNVMEKIDNAVLIDIGLGTIKTPYGITSIQHLSTGCKTVLNYIYIIDNMADIEMLNDIKAISANECGWNALEELFKVAESKETNIGIILEHENGVCMCSDREYCVDDTRYIHSLFDL